MNITIISIFLAFLSVATISSAYDCNVYATQKYPLRQLVPNIANNLDSQGYMNFQNNTYKWKSNIPASSDNMVLRFQFKRTGNLDKKAYVFWAEGRPSDYFQLSFKNNSMTVYLRSDARYYEEQTFQLSSKNNFNTNLTWFAFSFHHNRLDIYYDTKYLATIYDKVSLDQFSGIPYQINQSKDDYNGGGPVQGQMTNLEIYTDIQAQPFIDQCIGRGRPIYIYCDKYITYQNFLRNTFNYENRDSEYIIEDEYQEKL